MSEELLKYLATLKAKMEHAPEIRKATAIVNGLPEQKKIAILEAFMLYDQITSEVIDVTQKQSGMVLAWRLAVDAEIKNYLENVGKE